MHILQPKILFILTFLLFINNKEAFSQRSNIQFKDRVGDSLKLVNTQVKPPRQKSVPSLSNTHAFGFKLATNGYGIYYNVGKIVNNEGNKKEIDRIYEANYFTFALDRIKDPKEYKVSGYSGVGLANGYFYGKVNTLFSFKMGYAQRKLIAGKPEDKNVAIHAFYGGGLDFGLAIPYFYDTPFGKMQFNETNADTLLSTGVLVGGNMFEGLKKTSIKPGVYVKAGVHFDFANKKEKVIGGEVGVNVDYFFNKIPIMYGQDNKNLFLNAYLSVEIGRNKAKVKKVKDR